MHKIHKIYLPEKYTIVTVYAGKNAYFLKEGRGNINILLSRYT